MDSSLGVTMLLPKIIPRKVAAVVYPTVCALHGLAFGTLHAPAQALMFGLSYKQALAWIAAGIPWDLVHMAGNYAIVCQKPAFSCIFLRKIPKKITQIIEILFICAIIIIQCNSI